MIDIQSNIKKKWKKYYKNIITIRNNIMFCK